MLARVAVGVVAVLVIAWLGVLAEFPDETRDDVLGRTARRVYRLEEDHG